MHEGHHDIFEDIEELDDIFGKDGKDRKKSGEHKHSHGHHEKREKAGENPSSATGREGNKQP